MPANAFVPRHSTHLLLALLSVVFCVVTLGVLPEDAFADDGQHLIVSVNGGYPTIEDALASAHEGDTIEVHGGVHPTPLVITKSIILTGIGNPVIDGQGEGTLIFINAPDVTIQGFTIRNTGRVQHREDTAIEVNAPRAIITDNQLDNVLHGIVFNNAPESIAQGNVISGVGGDTALRGDGIRIWYSHDIQIVNNQITQARDVLISYSDNIVIVGNTFSDNRYGLHFMYNDQSVVNDNVFENNSVGAFLMYSADVTINNNIFAYNRGPSGYGLALKDMDEIVADGNFFVGNRAGLYLDNSPSVYEGFNIFSNNVFAYNDIGATSLPAVERNIFTGNSFLDNAQQVSMRGREVVSRNLWHYQGQGNFWSDYAGYDKDGDGIGEIPYKSDKLFESLSDKYPVIQFFTYSPVTQAIEFTGSAFPILRPHPKLIDEAPMMAYEFPAWLESDQDEVSASMIGLSAALLMVGVVLVGVAWTNTGKTAKSSGNTLAWTIKADPQTTEKAATNARGSQMIHVQGLTKRYGKHPVLEEVSFTIQKGESVALWGTNGAGKTTTLQCLLGVIPFQGTIEVNGVNVGKDGKQARHNIGYIPQEAIFYDLTVWKTIEFYARIKRANTSQLWEALERVGLKDHAEKSVKALSGGMKQRLALAISLLGDPPLLLLDEPTANLDAQARYEFLQLVQSLNQDGKTVVFSTHRLDEVRTLATRVIVLRDQGIFADCHPDMLTQQAALQQWLRVWIPQPQWETALHLLQNQGFSANPNGQAIYVQVGQKGKMAPLRVLETAQIAVQDFDLIDNNTAIIDSIGITTAEEVQS